MRWMSADDDRILRKAITEGRADCSAWDRANLEAKKTCLLWICGFLFIGLPFWLVLWWITGECPW